MKRRNFIKTSASIAAASATMPLMGMQPQTRAKSLYELRIYHVSRGANNLALLENYYKDALIPFLNKHNVKVGAFNEFSQEEPVKIYTLRAYPSVESYFNVQTALKSDPTYLQASADFFAIPASSPVYGRYEAFLMNAFDRWPELPATGTYNRDLFELRIYESPNDEAGNRKVEMFNKEEIDLFLNKGLQPVFFGKILAGLYMPALIYMVGLPGIEERDAAWNPFSTSQEWATMRVKPEYADIVSNIRRLFLKPLSFSQV